MKAAIPLSLQHASWVRWMEEALVSVSSLLPTHPKTILFVLEGLPAWDRGSVKTNCVGINYTLSQRNLSWTQKILLLGANTFVS